MNIISLWFLDLRIKMLQNQIQTLYSVEHSLWEHNQVDRMEAVQQLRERKALKLVELIAKEQDEK